MNLYVWEGACRLDWTGGDACVVAPDLEMAKRLVLQPHNGGSWDGGRTVPDPDHIVPVGLGVCWYGPGGG